MTAGIVHVNNLTPPGSDNPTRVNHLLGEIVRSAARDITTPLVRPPTITPRAARLPPVLVDVARDVAVQVEFEAMQNFETRFSLYRRKG